MLDYQKDNFNELDDFLNSVAENHKVRLRGSILAYKGCTKEEVENVMKTTVRSIVSDEEYPLLEKRIDKLLA